MPKKLCTIRSISNIPHYYLLCKKIRIVNEKNNIITNEYVDTRENE